MTLDVTAYNTAIQACAVGAQVERALRLFTDVEKSRALQANDVTFNAVLDAVCSADRRRARDIYRSALRRAMSANAAWEGGQSHWQLDLHEHSEGAAETAVRGWLEDEIPRRLQAAQDPPGETLGIVTGWGRSRALHQRSDVRGRVQAVLRGMGLHTVESSNPGRVAVDVAALRQQIRRF